MVILGLVQMRQQGMVLVLVDKMENQTKMNAALIVALIATWSFVGVTNIEATHYCESRELTANCLDMSSTGKTCYTLPGKTGGKRCTEGWNEIPLYESRPIVPTSSNSKQYLCDSQRCIEWN